MQKTNYPIKTPEELISCKVSPEEQECTISINRTESKITIYCSDNVSLTKIRRKWESNPGGYTCYAVKNNKGDVTGYFFETDKNNISFRSGKTSNKVKHGKPLTPEHKNKMISARREKKRKVDV